MGQMQNRNEGSEKAEDGTGSPHNRHDVKDRTGAKFGNEHDVNPAYAGGGAKGNKGAPGRPE